MKMYETAAYLESEIRKAENRLAELKNKLHAAEVREFYWHIKSALDACETPEKWDSFYATEWKISFGRKTINLYNCAQVFNGIEATLEEYMDDEGIEYKRGNEDGEI